MQKYFTILFWLFPFMCIGQVKDSVFVAKQNNAPTSNIATFKADKSDNYKSEIFTSGFIDIMNNGQVNASARFIRLFIGEQDKFSIPLSFYGGVSNNTFQNQNISNTGQLTKSNDHLVNQYITPLSGLVNVSIEGIAFPKNSESKITRLGYIYQIGERVLNGIRVGQLNNP